MYKGEYTYVGVCIIKGLDEWYVGFSFTVRVWA